MSGDVLFLVHRVPWPPDRGDKIRSHHLLRHIARISPVHVGTFAEGDHDMDQAAELATLAKSYRLVRRSKSIAAAAVQALLTLTPISLTAFADRRLNDYVADVLRKHEISTIFVFSAQMAQYVPSDFKGLVIMDFVDVDSAKFESYAKNDHGLMALGYRSEAFWLGRYERKIANMADHSIFISNAERALFIERNAGKLTAQERIEVVGNGIDTEHFDPAVVDAAEWENPSDKQRLLFSGQMDYPPNIEAVIRFTRRVMPLILQSNPNAEFIIAGRRPTDDVMALDGVYNTRVIGAVDDMRKWLKAADVVVAPLEIARGVQNKVLEAMAMARPVVLTTGAATGISAENGSHFIIADSDHDLAEAVVNLLAVPRKARAIGIAARRQMQDTQSWEANMTIITRLLGLTSKYTEPADYAVTLRGNGNIHNRAERN